MLKGGERSPRSGDSETVIVSPEMSWALISMCSLCRPAMSVESGPLPLPSTNTATPTTPSPAGMGSANSEDIGQANP